jgi:hypothetical protein
MGVGMKSVIIPLRHFLSRRVIFNHVRSPETSSHREMWEMTRLTRIRTDRRRVLAGGAALFVGTVAFRKADAQSATARGPEHAIFTEFSPESKLLKAGWNTSVFTHTDARRGNGIQCDFATGSSPWHRALTTSPVCPWSLT